MLVACDVRGFRGFEQKDVMEDDYNVNIDLVACILTNDTHYMPRK